MLLLPCPGVWFSNITTQGLHLYLHRPNASVESPQDYSSTPSALSAVPLINNLSHHDLSEQPMSLTMPLHAQPTPSIFAGQRPSPTTQPLLSAGVSLSPTSEPFPQRIVDMDLFRSICGNEGPLNRQHFSVASVGGSQWPTSPTIPASDTQATPARCDITIHLAVLLHGVCCHTFNGPIDKGYVSLQPFIDPGIPETWGEWVAGLWSSL